MRKYELTLNGKSFRIELLDLGAEEATFDVNGREITVTIDRVAEVFSHMEDSRAIEHRASRTATSAPPQTPPVAASGSAEPGRVTAPIPGSILSVYVKVGDTVAAGEPLLKMEAMKMENEINARIGGTVTAVNVQEGDSVSQGQELVLVSPQ
ncbi:MAG: biotin/lipoyl-containing protein [Geoalkalibacter sp.]|jgi:biotin carboxyl carrier protein|uniref:biotin/lipoyl-containing protein n=1 Tax=Geoalkalibacter sp. TaxID=3041440 RepID=UPI002A95D49C|nr:biotin/lipoyl-containing protein [Thermodesulfobacteriota bacterium]